MGHLPLARAPCAKTAHLRGILSVSKRPVTAPEKRPQALQGPRPD